MSTTTYYYKYMPYKQTEYATIVKTITVEKKKKTTDISRLVTLGGVFEQIGGNDESVGGGNQKVGSANK